MNLVIVELLALPEEIRNDNGLDIANKLITNAAFIETNSHYIY